MLVDIHCHVLADVDDGAKDLDSSIDMCRMAVRDGVDGIIATPHYIHGEMDNNRELVQQKVVELNGYLKEQNINIDIYPGCEAFICPNLPKLVRDGQVGTLNNTKYVLIELPMTSVPDYTADVIYRLKLNGYTPIIAHPERNAVIGKNPDVLRDLINRGAVTQINASSIKGLFGKGIMNTAHILLQHNMMHLLGSDAHTTGGRSPKLSSAMSIIEKQAGAEVLQNIIKNNQAVLRGEELEITEPIMVLAMSKMNFSGNFMKTIFGILK